jgi:beta-ureidopropionase / N-carbamoyl-L-amino-acid hydrolase
VINPLFVNIATLTILSIFSVNLLATDLPNAKADRMEARILALSEFGKNADGGVDRTAYSDADLAGRSYMIELMKKLGLEVSIDYAGNISGKRAGNNPELAPIIFGSHIDSVPGGGNYDGNVGVIGAIEVVELLNTAGIITEHPLEMIIFSDEEGGTVGSMAFAGILSPDAINDISSSGYKLGEGIDRIGGDHTKLMAAKRITPIHAFVELHIEQGGFLEQKNLNIGIVEGIVGIRWWTLTVEGVANHGGTTPMPGRKDALVAASKLIIAISERATQMEGQQVATVGKIQAFPGAPNVIPGKVELSLEIRDLDAKKIQHVYEMVKQEAKAVEESTGVKITFDASNVDIHPAPTHMTLRNLIEQSVNDLGLTYQYMPSGAGHDAQDMAPITPTGMIFVPSKGGISHSPKEYTSPQDMANGADVLLRTLMKLDKSKFIEE